MKKWLLLMLVQGVFWHTGYTQTRIYLQSGWAGADLQRYRSAHHTSAGLEWAINEHFSWGLGVDIMTPGRQQGYRNFQYCDSLTGYGWGGGECAPGHDTMVLSRYTRITRQAGFTAHLIYQGDLRNRMLWSHGIKLGYQRFTEDFVISDKLLAGETVPQTMGGLSVQYMNRFSLFPFQSRNHGEIYIETVLGWIYFRRADWVYNSLSGSVYTSYDTGRTFILSGGIQLGIAYQLSGYE